MNEFKVPLPKRKHKQLTNEQILGQTLEEEEYLERMGKIIKRDFFPEYKKLEDFKNRVNLMNDNPEPDKLTLNQFIREIKSEDNEMLRTIMERDQQAFKEKNWWIYLQESIEVSRQLKALEGTTDSINRGILDKDRRLAICPYEGLSSFFYAPQKWINPDDFQKETYKSKQIIYENTRFPETAEDFKVALKEEKKKMENIYFTNLDTPHLLGLREADERQNKDRSNYVQQSAKRDVPQKKQINGYDLLDIPEISPGREARSPIMTWGEIEDTPTRLIPDRGYKIPNYGDRDQVAEKLQQKFQNNKISKQRKTQEQLCSVIKDLTPNPKMKANLQKGGTTNKRVRELLKLNQTQSGSVFGTPMTPFSDVRSLTSKATMKTAKSRLTVKKQKG